VKPFHKTRCDSYEPHAFVELNNNNLNNNF